MITGCQMKKKLISAPERNGNASIVKFNDHTQKEEKTQAATQKQNRKGLSHKFDTCKEMKAFWKTQKQENSRNATFSKKKERKTETKARKIERKEENNKSRSKKREKSKDSKNERGL